MANLSVYKSGCTQLEWDYPIFLGLAPSAHASVESLEVHARKSWPLALFSSFTREFKGNCQHLPLEKCDNRLLLCILVGENRSLCSRCSVPRAEPLDIQSQVLFLGLALLHYQNWEWCRGCDTYGRWRSPGEVKPGGLSGEWAKSALGVEGSEETGLDSSYLLCPVGSRE